MRAIWRPIVLVALSASAACSSVSVDTHHDPQVDFSTFRTYTWIEPTEEVDRGQILPDHLDLRLRRVVDDIMAEKGLQKAPVLPQADLLLVYYVGLRSELRVTTVPYGFYRPYMYGYWPGSPYGVGSVRRYSEGTVVLDIIDRSNKQLVWTGAVTSAVHRANPPSDRIAKVVEQLLAGFPPQ